MGKRRLRSHNALLANYDGADGIKTGFICDSGFNIVASATRDGRRLVAVVLGEVTGRERSTRAANLLEYGFHAHGWKSMFGMENVNTMPVAADAKGVVSIRHAVISWACGTGRRRTLARSKRKREKAVAAAKANAGPQKQDKGPAAAKVRRARRGQRSRIKGRCRQDQGEAPRREDLRYRQIGNAGRAAAWAAAIRALTLGCARPSCPLRHARLALILLSRALTDVSGVRRERQCR